MRGVVAYVPDLMDRSRLGRAGAAVTVVATPAELAGAAAGADVVVVDLSRPGVLDVLGDVSATGVRTIGFAPHVDRALAEEARAAGCDQVLARSAFFSQLAALLG